MGADGGRARFEAMFAATSARVFAFALRRADDRSSAEEVMSETFLIAWRRLDAVPEEPLPWLLATARRVLANQRRSARRRSHKGPTVPVAIVETPDPRTPFPELVADREAFASAFAALGERDREALTLIAWDGLKPREAAKVMRCTPAAFHIRLHRARRRLLKELASSGHSLGEGSNRSLLRPQTGATREAQ